ncbi:TetR/AcrR family transcriptional regulator [Corynebacterium sp. AOP40-9SA-29]|uniref:TetR/AcrR family transcriptional regulator n=1 Tax=Corynebacterium sp. AOP40-9SA-29 TaxID=3457677 RepID=UPI004034A36C
MSAPVEYSTTTTPTDEKATATSAATSSDSTSDSTSEKAKPRRRARNRRADGERSRQRILAAATHIAAERGYDGTSIAEICRECGLPASSLYWHFQDKDDLMSQVISKSFDAWNQAWDIPVEEDILTHLPQIAEQLLDALENHPEFIRLCLPLALQKRSDDPSPRRMYLQMRADVISRLSDIAAAHFGYVPEHRRVAIVTYMVSGVEGLFVDHEMNSASNLRRQLDLHAMGVISIIMQEASSHH